MNDMASDGVAVPSPEGAVLTEQIACIQCAYSLYGLPLNGQCPECATPVARTLEAVDAGFTLSKSSPEYVRTLLSGSSFILNGILIQIVLMVVGIFIGIAMASSAAYPGVSLALEGLGLLVSLAIAFGWWRLSTPDPVLQGQFDGGKARQIVRVCVLIGVAAGLLSFLVSGIITTGILGANGLVAGGLLLFLIGLLSMVAWVVAFFAQMLYIRWLAPRLPNHAVAKRAKTLMWLGPVLYTVGLLLLGLGPLIALVLYWNMLDKVRKDLKGIVADSGPAGGFPTAH